MPRLATFRFGRFELQPSERRVLCGGAPVPLPGKAFDVLTLLVEQAPHLVRKEAFFETVWADAVVEESNLNYTIALVRKALRGESGGEPFIETVPRQGYRFVAPVQRVQAGIADSPARADSGGRSLLVQRDAELDALGGALARARQGVREVVFITGDAGIGKTSLLDRFLTDGAVRDAWVSRGHCVEHRGEAEAYLPVLEAIGRLCRGPADGLRDALERFAPSWLVQMPALLAPGQLETLQQRLAGVTRERMLRELDEALVAATAAQTIVLVLEDLHWADASTMDFVSRVARGGDPARLLLIGTYRPADALSASHPVHAVVQELQLRGACRLLRLPRLSPASVVHYVHQRFNGAVPASIAEQLHARTGGHPLFVAALVDSWCSRGTLQDRSGVWVWDDAGADSALDVPDSLRAFLEQEIHELPRDERDLLQAAAVVGPEFTSGLVAAALDAPVDQVEAACAGLARIGRFARRAGQTEYPDGTVCERYTFVHAFYVEVLLGSLPAGRRVRFHQQVALALEQRHGAGARAVAADLAAHFRAARDARNAVRYLQMSAEQSMARSAPREAIGQLQDALAMLPRIPDADEREACELPIQTMLGQALTATRGFEDPAAEAAFRRGYDLARARRSPHLFPIAFGLATTLELRGQYRDAHTIMAAHLGEQAAGGPFEAECRDLLACSTFHQGAFADAWEHAWRGLQSLTPDRHSPLMSCFGEHPGVGCQVWAALASWFLGHPDRAIDEARRAVALADAPDRTYSLANAQVALAWVHQLRREPRETQEWAARAIALGQRQGFAHRVAAGQVLHGWARGAQGDPEAGLPELRQGLAAAGAIGLALDRPYFLALACELLLATHRWDEALAALDEADRLVAASRSFFFEAELLRLRGAWLLAAGAPDAAARADEYFERALATASRQGAASLRQRTLTSRARSELRSRR